MCESQPAGVLAHRLGALERVQLLLANWREARRRLDETEARMTTVLDELHLSGLATSVTGLSALRAAAILAETGDTCCRTDSVRLSRGISPYTRSQPTAWTARSRVSRRIRWSCSDRSMSLTLAALTRKRAARSAADMPSALRTALIQARAGGLNAAAGGKWLKRRSRARRAARDWVEFMA